MQAFVAELVGTMILVIFGDGVVANVVLRRTKGNQGGWIVITTGWGLAVALAVYCVGRISGAHLNPAVSIGLASIGQFEWSQVGPYVAAQTIGGVADNGKYVTIWKKQPDTQWKVTADIFNSDLSAPPSAHVMVPSSSITWGDPPPALPPGAKLAVITGDPSKPGPFVIRVQFPAGYKVPPHWHPTDENVTVLSGTMALGMGEAWDDAKMQALPAGSYVVLPAEMRHSVMVRTAATIQITGMGPFVVNYVNPADDPSKAK